MAIASGLVYVWQQYGAQAGDAWLLALLLASFLYQIGAALRAKSEVYLTKCGVRVVALVGAVRDIGWEQVRSLAVARGAITFRDQRKRVLARIGDLGRTDRDLVASYAQSKIAPELPAKAWT